MYNKLKATRRTGSEYSTVNRIYNIISTYHIWSEIVPELLKYMFGPNNDKKK